MELSTSPLPRLPRGLEKDSIFPQNEKLVLSSLKSHLKPYFDPVIVEKIYFTAQQAWNTRKADHLYYLDKKKTHLPKGLFIHEAARTIFLNTNELIGKGKQNNVKKALMIRVGDSVNDTTVIPVAVAIRRLGFLAEEKEEIPEWETKLQDKVEDALQELQILKAAKGAQNIIAMFNAAIYDGYSQKQKVEKLAVFYPLFQDNLYSIHKENASTELSKSECVLAAYKLAVALRDLHEKKIIHRDVKLDNVLFHRNGKNIDLVLADFGHAIHRELTEKVKIIGGSVIAWPPENFDKLLFSGELRQEFFHPSVDNWALGVMIYELFFDTIPWEDTLAELIETNNSLLRLRAQLDPKDPFLNEKHQNIKDLEQKIYTQYNQFHASVQEFQEKETGDASNLIGILQKLLRWNADERITAAETAALLEPVVKLIEEMQEGE